MDGPCDMINQRKIGNPKRCGSLSAGRNDYPMGVQTEKCVPPCKMKSRPGPCLGVTGVWCLKTLLTVTSKKSNHPLRPFPLVLGLKVFLLLRNLPVPRKTAGATAHACLARTVALPQGLPYPEGQGLLSVGLSRPSSRKKRAVYTCLVWASCLAGAPCPGWDCHLVGRP